MDTEKRRKMAIAWPGGSKENPTGLGPFRKMTKAPKNMKTKTVTESSLYRFGVLSADQKKSSVTGLVYPYVITFVKVAGIILRQSRRIMKNSVFHFVVTTPPCGKNGNYAIIKSMRRFFTWARRP